MRSISRRVRGVALALVSLLVAAPTAEAFFGGHALRVMTRNLYIGTDLAEVVAAPPEAFPAAVAAALAEMAANDFPLRAQALAEEARRTRPDVIVVQEAFRISLDGATPGPPFVDYLSTYLDALAARRIHYEIAAQVEHFDATLPLIDPDAPETMDPPLLRVLDRDVILVRKGTSYEPLDGDFRDGGLCGVPVPAPEGASPPAPPVLTSTPSEDGCNFSVFASADTPAGLLAIERGFVGIDVRVRRKRFRIVNTHLEVQLPDPTQPASAAIQSLQAVELVGSLLATTPPGRTLILGGDTNSSPADVGPLPTPYQVIRAAGFADAWDDNLVAWFNPDGATCCQDADLANTTSALTDRIDQIFVLGAPFVALAIVTGNEPQIEPGPPVWGSDHGGVAAKLLFPRGHPLDRRR